MKRKTTTTTVTIEDIDSGAPARAQKTLVSFLLDRSGSMASIKDDTIGGFNTYLDTLDKEAGDLVEFTLLQFDSDGVDKLCVGVPLKNVVRLNRDNFIPRASTPLIDAAMKTIRATEELAAKRAHEHPRVVVAIMTDGQENCSSQYTRQTLVETIREKTKAGWQFLYMGANIDAYGAAASYGISRGSTVSYNSQNSQSVFRATAHNVGRFSAGASASVGYTAKQKMAAGDTIGLTHKPVGAAHPLSGTTTTIVDDITF